MFLPISEVSIIKTYHGLFCQRPIIHVFIHQFSIIKIRAHFIRFCVHILLNAHAGQTKWRSAYRNTSPKA